MADPKKSLFSKFEKNHRYSNFGSAIISAKINGFRGISAEINFEYPVTALTGLNGSGKSTICQILLCGYKKLSTSVGKKRYYIANFFPISVVDPHPFSTDALVTFKYQTDKASLPQELTISRSQKEWSGYKRQPNKNTEYIGFTVYIPKVERRDLSIYGAKDLLLSERRDIENINEYVGRILGVKYDDVYFQGVKKHLKSSELGMAGRYGAIYSENNMGFGEGIVVYTVSLLETCPVQSLIVIEEPETSLHESAQYEFAKYFIDVSNRRGHQIIFSTHSSAMMDAIPPEGRKLLVRQIDGVSINDRVTSTRIKTALSEGERGHLIICVEDEFAQSFIREILRRYDINFMKTVSVIPFGDTKAVKIAKEVLEKAGISAVAVRDPDKGESKSDKIFKLPGSNPLEIEVFNNNSVKNFLINNYGINIDNLIASSSGVDFHNYSTLCCEKASTSREVIEMDCIRIFLDDMTTSWFEELCKDIKSSQK